ncbi:MAG: NAD(P)-dependent alcohol dehydrogenase [Pseudomonadota bacterium]
MKTYSAAVLRQKNGHFAIERIDMEPPRAREVVVKIAGVGLCHTDLVVREGHYPIPFPMVLGHEGSGIVHMVGSEVAAVAPGDHVVLSFGFDSQCKNCMNGQPAYSDQFFARNFSGRRPDGTTPLTDSKGEDLSAYFFAQSSFGEYAIAPEESVVKIDPDVPIEIMGPLGCGIQTGAGAVMNALACRAGTSIAVFGAGSVGLAAVLAARAVGCTQIIAVDLVEHRLDIAQKMGATHTINGGTENAVERILQITDGGAQYALDCTGVPAVVRQSVECLRLTGMAGLLGVPKPGAELTLELRTLLSGRGIRGIIEGDSVPRSFIPELVALWKTGRFPFDSLIKTYRLDQIEEAIHDTETGEVVKAVLLP